MNRLFRTIAPIGLPVSLDEVKTHLAIRSDDDAYLTSLIEAATAMIDGPSGIGIALLPQTYRYSMDGMWPTFTLPIYPVRAVQSVDWIDNDNLPRSATDVRVDSDCNPARVYATSTGSTMAGTVKVTFTAGFDVVPADLRHAILMLVGHLFENREAASTAKLETVPMAVDTILSRYRMF
eukprot:gene21277-22103_t